MLKRIALASLALLLFGSGCRKEEFVLQAVTPKDQAKDVPLNAAIAVTFEGKEFANEDDISQDNFQLVLVTAEAAKQPPAQGAQKQGATEPGGTATGKTDAAGQAATAQTAAAPAESESPLSIVIRPLLTYLATADDGSQRKRSVVHILPLPSSAEATSPLPKAAHLRLKVGTIKSASGKYAYSGGQFNFTTAASGMKFSEDDQNGVESLDPDLRATSASLLDPRTLLILKTQKPVNPLRLAQNSNLKAINNYSSANDTEVLKAKLNSKSLEERTAEKTKTKKTKEDELKKLQARADCPADNTRTGCSPLSEKERQQIEELENTIAELDKEIAQLKENKLQGSSYSPDETLSFLVLQIEAMKADQEGLILAKYNTFAFRPNRLTKQYQYKANLGTAEDSTLVDFYFISFDGAYITEDGQNSRAESGEWILSNNTLRVQKDGYYFEINKTAKRKKGAGE